MRKALMLAVMMAAGVAAAAPTPPPEGPLVRALRDELARTMAQLVMPDAPKPYYVAFLAWDTTEVDVAASFGAIVHQFAGPSRHVQLDLRVGDYAFDNSNMERSGTTAFRLPLDDDYDAIRRSVWLATDSAYKRATETLERKRAVAKGEVQSADTIAAFSHEPVLQVNDRPTLVPDDPIAVAALVTKLSAVFRDNHDAFRGTATISSERGLEYFIASDGSFGAQPMQTVKLELACSTQAADGTPMRTTRAWFADSAAKLPPEAELVAAAEQLSRELSARRTAPIADDYAGPILFSGVAADQLLRVLLAEELGGTPPPKSERAGHSDVADSELAGKVGIRILPLGTSLVDDPHVKFDEEGVVPTKVSLVENGTFKRFLMSRTPRKGFEHSNGHGYTTSGGGGARAHPTNLVVTAAHPIADAELRKRAIAAAKEEGLPYVAVVERFEDGGGGGADDFDPTMFSSGLASLPRPAVLKKLYVDGHEELVRGGLLGGITLRSLRDILAFGKTATPYRYQGGGYRGVADLFYGGTGGYSATITSPALLLRDGEVKKPLGAQRTPPIAPRPTP